VSKKTKTLKRLSDKDLAKLVGGFKDSPKAKAPKAQAMSASGSTWLYSCWEGVCTPYAKSEALRKATPKEKRMLEESSAPAKDASSQEAKSY